MAFRVYKPKNFVTLKAEQVTLDSISDLAGRLMGRIADSPFVKFQDPQPVLDVPTFDGPIRFELGDYVIKNDDNTIARMSADEFEKTYELARNTTATVTRTGSATANGPGSVANTGVQHF